MVTDLASLARVTTRIVTSDHVALSRQYGHLPRTFRLLKATVRAFCGALASDWSCSHWSDAAI